MRKTNFFKSSLMILLFCIGLTSAWGQLTENFETGLPTGYTTGNFTLASGTWNGTEVIRNTQYKFGSFSAQLRSTNGSNITTPTITSGVGIVTFWASGSTTNNGIQIQISVDGGAFQTVQSFTPPQNTLTQYNATVNNGSNNIKVRFARTSGTIYLDNVEITSYATNPCDEGTLTGGTTEATPAEVAPGGSTTLSLTGASTGTGLSYQWQSSADGIAWSDISGATTATYNATNITAITYFRAEVTCGTSTVESTPVLVTLAYCAAGANDTDYETISNFTFGTINNDSVFDNSGYEDFTTVNTNIEMGVEVPFSVSLTETYSTDQVLIWIDLNQNSIFDANELLFESAISDANPVIGTITIPATATEGSTRLRIRLQDSDGVPSNNTPCGNSQFGEVEDYTVNILPAQGPITWLANNTWSNGTGPSSTTDDVVIEGTLVTTGDLSAQNLTVVDGGGLTVSAGNTVTLAGKIINEAGAANFVIESGANLIQNGTYTANDNEGEITVMRESQPIKRLDYTLWSSPVTGQELQAFSPMTLANRIYTYEGASQYVIVPSATADFDNGKGYLFRAPNDADATTETPYMGEFQGVPFNGDVTVNTIAGNFTSIGNPYPSNIDADLLLASNTGISTIYFWNNTGVAGSNYATYTNLGGTAAAGGSAIPTNFISVGQGFLVETTDATVSFDNTMRVADASTFFKVDQTEKHRIWLNLNNDQNEGLNQILVGYMAGATDNFDNQIDGKLFQYEGSALYNIIGEEKFAIQGKALPFETSDVVVLGFKTAQAGKFNIALDNLDGLFAEGNVTVYLKDNELNITHNLSESAYAFESAVGEFNTRFEVVYETEEVMGTRDLTTNSVQIYTQNDQIVVSSKSEKILSVELFDLSGRNIYTNNKVNANSYEFKSASKGVLVVRVQTQNGEIVTKKVINK